MWFWSAVARTAASQVWREITESPARLTGCAFLGAIIEVAVGFLVAFLPGLLFFFAAMWGLHPAQWVWNVVLETPSLIAALLIGRLLARWAVDRELAVGLVYVILTPAVALITDPPEGLGVLAVVALFFSTMALQTPALAGAVWGRRRRAQAVQRRRTEG